jgi:(p)ppGpp synthase/HD superfamily hydrolase
VTLVTSRSRSITATFKVTSLQQLANVLAKIERQRDVTSVTREAR